MREKSILEPLTAVSRGGRLSDGGRRLRDGRNRRNRGNGGNWGNGCNRGNLRGGRRNRSAACSSTAGHQGGEEKVGVGGSRVVSFGDT